MKQTDELAVKLLSLELAVKLLSLMISEMAISLKSLHEMTLCVNQEEVDYLLEAARKMNEATASTTPRQLIIVEDVKDLQLGDLFFVDLDFTKNPYILTNPFVFATQANPTGNDIERICVRKNTKVIRANKAGKVQFVNF